VPALAAAHSLQRAANTHRQACLSKGQVAGSGCSKQAAVHAQSGRHACTAAAGALLVLPGVVSCTAPQGSFSFAQRLQFEHLKSSQAIRMAAPVKGGSTAVP